jgi:hypothetical protein
MVFRRQRNAHEKISAELLLSEPSIGLTGWGG